MPIASSCSCPFLRLAHHHTPPCSFLNNVRCCSTLGCVSATTPVSSCSVFLASTSPSSEASGNFQSSKATEPRSAHVRDPTRNSGYSRILWPSALVSWSRKRVQLKPNMLHTWTGFGLLNGPSDPTDETGSLNKPVRPDVRFINPKTT